MAVKVPIEFFSDFSQAVKDFSAFNKKVNPQIDKLEKNFGMVGTAIKGAIGLFAVGKIVNGLEAMVNASAEAERTTIALRNAMKNSGDYSKQNEVAFRRLADQIQRTTIYEDDLVLSQVALAKSFGLTNRETASLIKASVQLAAAQGIDLNTAVQLLGRSYDGTAGRLNEMIPAVRSLTAEQLRGGAAVDLVAKKFAGSAEAIGSTYTGSIAKAKNAFGNLLEAMGDFITQSPAVIKSIEIAARVFNGWAMIIGGPQTESEKLRAELKNLFTEIKNIENAMKTYKVTNNEAAISMSKLKLDELRKKYNDVYGELEKVRKSTKKSADGFDELSTKAKRFNPELATQIEALMKDFQFAGSNAIEEITNKFNEQIKLIDQAKASGFRKDINYAELRNKIETKFIQDKAKLEKELQDKNLAELQSRLQKISSNPFSEIMGNGGNAMGGKFNLSGDQSAGLATGLAGLQGVMGGKEGAIKMAGMAASAAGTALLGPAGQALGPIVEMLAQGPEKVKEMVREFARAVPDIIEAIIESIPVLIEELANQFPIIIERLADKAPDIIQALVKGMPRAMVAMALQMPKVALALIKSLVGGAPQFIGKLLEGAAQFVGKILEGAAKFVEKIVSGATGGAIGKGGSVIGWGGDHGGLGVNIGGFKFAEGGEVPDGFPNDTAPSMLSSGEYVIDRELTRDLKKMAKGNQAEGGPTTIVVQIGNKKIAEVMIDLQRKGYRILDA